MTVKLTNAFLANSRGVTLADGGGITWSIDLNTNAITANGSSAGASGANPTGTIGLAAVNGTASTFIRSDGAPKLSQAIVPTWSGLHTFGAGLTISAGAFTLNGYTLALSANATVGGTNTGDQTLPTGANPSASVGLAAVGGSSASFMRADGAPALSVAITPTWTGAHDFTGGIQINGINAGYLGSPINRQDASYALVAADKGKTVLAAGSSGITYTAPASVFSAGDVVHLVNFINAGSMTIAAGSGLTLYWLNGTTGTGNRTLTANGYARLQFFSATVALISGFGLT